MVLPTSSPNTEGILGTKPVFLVTKLVRGYEKIFFLCIVDLNLKCVCPVWQYRLWSFQTGGTKLEIFLPKNQHNQRKLLNFENWVNGEVSKIGHLFGK